MALLPQTPCLWQLNILKPLETLGLESGFYESFKSCLCTHAYSCIYYVLPLLGLHVC